MEYQLFSPVLPDDLQVMAATGAATAQRINFVVWHIQAQMNQSAPVGRLQYLSRLRLDWYRLFGQRCEKPLKKVADRYSDLFSDLVHLFNGRPAGNHFQSDVAMVLEPLPLVPLLICYWHPEEGMGSNMNLFFDASAEDNLGIGGRYALGTGITRMFERLALRHGHAPA